MYTSDVPWSELEQAIRRDPGGRGVSSYRRDGRLLGEGQLAAASVDLAHSARAVAIVTGFCVFDGQQWVAETDGPPGALFLARALLELGIEVELITDAYCRAALEVGCDHWTLPRHIVHCMPLEAADDAGATQADAWVQAYLDVGSGRRLTHLLAIERPGPSHTLESFLAQPRVGPPPRELFERDSPPATRNHCHNMRGVAIDAQTARTHRLFEAVADRRSPIVTLGLADGGNEIGMGHFAWEVLREAIAQGPAGQVACRIAADFSLLSGVSNWSAYALACAVCRLRGRADLLAAWDAENQRDLIEKLAREASLVDGVTKRHEATVDGLSLDEYLKPLTVIRRLLA